VHLGIAISFCGFLFDECYEIYWLKINPSGTFYCQCVAQAEPVPGEWKIRFGRGAGSPSLKLRHLGMEHAVYVASHEWRHFGAYNRNLESRYAVGYKKRDGVPDQESDANEFAEDMLKIYRKRR
jgi:hypothetical protein